jgi:putative tryptophan/tyrosine transport system substrate-binding protein
VKRREFIALLAGTATWPIAARGQQPAMPVIGFLSSRSPGESANLVEAFRQGLRESGFVEGQNAAIAFRWAEGHTIDCPRWRQSSWSCAWPCSSRRAGHRRHLPLKRPPRRYLWSSRRPLTRTGLNRPGGNVTGMSFFPLEIAAKSVQLLKELLPAATLIGYLVNPSTPAAHLYGEEASNAAKALGIAVHILNASTESDLDEAFASLAKADAGGLVVPAEPFFDSQRDRIVVLAARHAIPAIYGLREYAVAGGLMSYGASLPNAYRQGGIYVGRVLKGEKPADLPVQQATKYDLVLNLKTAKALGLTVPDRLLALADEVIE